MAKTFWIHVAFISFFLVLMVTSRRIGGWRGRVGGWKSKSNYNPSYKSLGGSNYKPAERKTSIKHMAGAAAAGGVGGFMLGNAVSNRRYRFDNDMDSRYYNRYQNQMPSQAYQPRYQENSYVTKDRFVTDCYNMSMTEYVIKANAGKNISEIDQTEVRVKSSVIRQLCDEEYKRRTEDYNSSGLNLLFTPSLILDMTLLAYFLVE